MSAPKVGALGLIIAVAFILNVIAVFTSGWVTVTAKVGGYSVSKSTGIVPYQSGLDGWFEVASWMMFISFGLFFPLILGFLLVGWKVHHHGCGHSIRHWFHVIALLSAIEAILQATAFILFACNVSTSYNTLYGSTSAQPGYSAYLALVSAILSIAAMGLSAHVSHHHCCH